MLFKSSFDLIQNNLLFEANIVDFNYSPLAANKLSFIIYSPKKKTAEKWTLNLTCKAQGWYEGTLGLLSALNFYLSIL